MPSSSAGERAAPGGGALRAGFLLALLFLSGFYTYVAFAQLAYLSSAGRLGPGFMPRIIGVALVAMCALSLYLDLRRPAGGGAQDDGAGPGWRAAAVLALLTGVFVGLLEVLGGLASMIAFMAASLAILNRGRTLQNAIVSVLLPLAVHAVFTLWLRAAMPRGLLTLPF